MDAAFRGAAPKGSLWEDVSRKMAELGYNRSGKKCKEKFENVHKYYKRTKDGRAGRHDGKSYRFFSQLEALHSGGATASSQVGLPGPSFRALPQAATPISVISPLPPTNSSSMCAPMDHVDATVAGGISSSAAAAGIRFSSSTSASSSDDEETEEGIGVDQETSRKRKRGGGGCSSRKIMAFFEGLMKQVMERQEQMQQRFLETLEKREQERIFREEAWRRQEMARLAGEHEQMAQECVMAANRDAAVIAFLRKVTGETFQLPVVTPTPLPQPFPQSPAPQPQYRPPPPPSQPTPIAAPQDQQMQPSISSADLVHLPEPQETTPASGGYVAPSSRWPNSEVHALIKLRTGLEPNYQEGSKGPLWEEISSEMKKLGYNRSPKRCKQKWENINKYFKKVKESNKKRPEDAKTCPYFHQLDALYRKKQLASSAATAADTLSTSPPPAPSAPPQLEAGAKNGGTDGGNIGIETHTSNSSSFLEDGNTNEKPEDTMTELMPQQQHQNQAVMDYDKLEEDDRDNVDVEDYGDDDEEDEEDGKMQYKIQFQRQIGSGNTATAAGDPPVKTPPTTTAGSFLAMVQ